MDLETQQEQLEEANKLNNILISIEKQNSLLDELSKNSQKPKPSNTITLEKPDLDIKNKNSESKQIEKPENKEVNLEIKEEIKSDEPNENNNEEAELDKEVEINNLENNQKEDLTKMPARVPDNKESAAIAQKTPDWFNTVKEQLKDLISNSNINVKDELVEKDIKENIGAEQEKEEIPQSIQKEENFKNLENLEKNAVQEESVENLNANQPVIQEIKLDKNTRVITEKIIEKADNNRQEIENLREESNLELPTEKENIDEVKTEEEEVKPQISITLKNNTINEKIKEEISDIESSEPVKELLDVENNEALEIDASSNNKDNSIKEESPNNILQNNTVENKNQEDTIDSEQSTPQEASFTTEEISETPVDSNNSLESLVSEISKQLTQLTQNNDKNFLNIANIMIGINSTLRSMNNNLNNIGNNNVFVNGEGSSSSGAKKSTDNFNESNLQRYRQQIRNSDMINDVATRVLRHSIPGVTI